MVSSPLLDLAEAHGPEGRCLRGISESKESEKRTSRDCCNLPELLSCLYSLYAIYQPKLNLVSRRQSLHFCKRGFRLLGEFYSQSFL